MSLLNVKIGDKSPEIFNAVVEIPKDSQNKYEIDKQTGMVSLDRVLYSPMHYPADYGFIPETKAEDGDPAERLTMAKHLQECAACSVALLEFQNVLVGAWQVHSLRHSIRREVHRPVFDPLE